MKFFFISILLLLLIILGHSTLISSSNDLDAIIQSSSNIEYLEVDDGYYLDVYTEKEKNIVRTGDIKMSRANEIFYAKIENAGKLRNFILKIYLDYNEISMEIDGESTDAYYFTALPGHAYTIPFTFSDQIDMSLNHKMTVMLIAGADIYSGLLEYDLTDHFSLSINYNLNCSIDNQLSASRNVQYEKIESVLDPSYSGVLINTDFTGDSQNRLPPKMLTSSINEEIQLGYRAGGYSGVSNYCILLNLGWEQAPINGFPYKLIQTKAPGDLGYGEISIRAPRQAGLYEISAWIIPDPFDKKIEFVPLESSYRFTLKVAN